MSTAYYFVEPIDVLMLRGNRSFGDAGEHGEALLPPWPSLFAGAFRSALLAHDATRLSRFASLARASDSDISEDERSRRMRELLGDDLFATLGTPRRPGTFRIHWASLATREGAVRAALPLPADLATQPDDKLLALQPASLPAAVRGSNRLPMTALLRSAKPVKQTGGRWLAGDEFDSYLRGHAAGAARNADALYRRETRLGIALDSGSRTASDGALYTTEAITLAANTGFLIGIQGAPGLADEGLLRLGGDGRGARWQRVEFELPPAPAVAHGGRFRLLLTTPGIFSGGWLPEGVARDADGEHRLHGDGFAARLVCAAMARHEVVSGWDLAHWAPKTAQRVAPAGSVFWFDRFEGDASKLAAWAEAGLWPNNGALADESAQRRAEGFNNALLADWIESVHLP
jgi:CRISPR-associated protein Cmr3